MAENGRKLTPVLGQQICAFIRAGGYPAVAAEASGVRARTFREWLARGNKKRAREPYRSFAASVREASAHARVKAEMAAYKKDAMAWLKSGPGRETGAAAGWSQPVRAAAKRGRRGNPLASPEVGRVLAVLLEALAEFPEARAAAAAALSPAKNVTEVE